MLYIVGDINSGLVGNTFVHQCQSSYLSSFFRELANLVALGRWLRIPPPWCKFLLRCVLPCAGPVRAMISDILYTNLTQYNNIPTLISLAICRPDL